MIENTTARRPRAVIADDHESSRKMISTLLSRTHEVVAAVGDGEALLESAGDLAPDLIIVDVDMPRLTGIEALQRLRQQDSRALIMIVTVTEDRELALKALKLGANAFVVKSRLVRDFNNAISAATDGISFISPMGRKSGR